MGFDEKELEKRLEILRSIRELYGMHPTAYRADIYGYNLDEVGSLLTDDPDYCVAFTPIFDPKLDFIRVRATTFETFKFPNGPSCRVIIYQEEKP